ncbi:MAG: pyruvate formate lyase family protein [Planctomycetota bacterium]
MNRRDFLHKSLATGVATALPGASSIAIAAPANQSNRIARLEQGVSGLPPPEICFERARFMTDSYRQTAGEAPVVRKALAILSVAEGLPILIRPDELVVGNIASRPRVAYFAPESYRWSRYRSGAEQVLQSDLLFGHEIRFHVPQEMADFWRKMPEGDTVGHFVPDYSKVIRVGFSGLAAEAARCREEHRRARTLDAAKEAFYRAAEISCRTGERFALRHAEAARVLAKEETEPARRTELERIAAACEHVAFQPAQSFQEALQAFWLTHVLIHINSSEWSISPGRFDQYMWPYYDRDITAGRLTREQAAELLACLWIKFNEVRVCAADIINYQNLLIGGVDPAGADATNELSYLCIETTMRLKGLTQPSLSMRWHAETPEPLLSRAAELILTGSGRPAMFNDRICIAALERAGVTSADARDYAIAGCEELAVAGKVFGVCRSGITNPNQAQCVLNALGENPPTFEALLGAYRKQLTQATRRQIEAQHKRDERSARHTPHPFVSLLFEDCLRAGQDVSEGGARYNISSLAEAGTITAANSLYAVKKVVYEEPRVSLPDLRTALAANFAGFAHLRTLLADHVSKFGNDDDGVDRFARDIVSLNRRVLDDLGMRDYRNGTIVPGSGISTAWKAGHRTGATPDGRYRGQSLSISLGPAAGSERLGPTAVLNSVAKLDWEEQAGGALTHVQLPYAATQSDRDTGKLAGLIRGFFRQGGMGVHFSVVDVQLLKAAMREPEKHLHVLVRMGGYSAPFALLSPELQRDILARMGRT